MSEAQKFAQLGDRVQDVVTKVEGVVIGITTWLTGCDQLVISRGMDKEGKVQDTFYCDIHRAKVIEGGRIELPVPKTEGIGGPTPRY